ncbi:MAG: hypothetical protein WBV80_24755 [Mycobacterium sp.]
MRWSNPVCATSASRKPGPISSQRTFKTPANHLTANSLFPDVLTNPHSRLEHVERVIGIGDSGFSVLRGGYGFRCSYCW